MLVTMKEMLEDARRNHYALPLTAIEDFASLGETDPRFKVLSELVEQSGGLWNAAAEKYLLENF